MAIAASVLGFGFDFRLGIAHFESFTQSYVLDTRPRAIVFSPRSLELTLTMLFEDRLWLRLA